jgi:hypothetical protein
LTAKLFHRTITPEVLLAARAAGALLYLTRETANGGKTSMPMKKKAKKKKKH